MTRNEQISITSDIRRITNIGAAYLVCENLCSHSLRNFLIILYIVKNTITTNVY